VGKVTYDAPQAPTASVTILNYDFLSHNPL